MSDFRVITLLTLFGLLSCSKFEYSPYQKFNEDTPSNLNALNYLKLSEVEAAGDDTVTILFTGDSQRFYQSLDKLVAKANSIESVDMLFLAGDISDFGLLHEFHWIYERLEKLNVPYFCAIGNHDLLANGGAIYDEMFGPRNFTISYKGYKFLFHDTNGREYDFNGTVPDIGWLASSLNDSVHLWFVGVSHVPPNNLDFDEALEIPYKDLFASRQNFILSLHGHLHGSDDSHLYSDHVRYISCYAVNMDKCILLKFINGTIIKEIINY